MSDDKEEKTDFHLVDEKPSQKDWEISDLYSKSWQIIKNHKVTWIFGAAVAATAAGSSNFNSSSSGDSESLQKLFNQGIPEASSSAEMSQVLGESIGPFQQLGQEILNRIPMHYYMILAGEILFLIVVGILISVIYRAWAHASLIESVYSAYKQSKTTIAEASESGFKHIKSFIWLDIIPWLIVFTIVFIYGFLFTLGMILGNFTVKGIVLVLGILGLIPLLYYALLISLGIIWGYREVAISDLSAKQAFWNGFKIAKKKKGASLILGIVNTFAAIIVTMIPVFLLIAAIAPSFIGYFMTKEISPVLIGLAVVATAILIPIMVILGAVVQAFKASVWTIAYDKIKGKYTNES